MRSHWASDPDCIEFLLDKDNEEYFPANFADLSPRQLRTKLQTAILFSKYVSCRGTLICRVSTVPGT